MSPITLGQIRYYLLSSLGAGFFVFFLLSLCSFDPADPTGMPSTLVFPNHHAARNWCGEAGAYWALWAYTVFGLGVWCVMLSGAFHLTRYLTDCHSRRPFMRFTGWCVALVGLCSFLGLALPKALPTIMIGSGGYLGMALTMNLTVLGTVGSMIVSVAVMLFGLTLYSDYFVPAFLVARLGGRRAEEETQDAAEAELYPLHGLYTGYIDMDAVRAELAARLAVETEEEPEAETVPARIPGKPAVEGMTAAAENTAAVDVPSRKKSQEEKKAAAGDSSRSTPPEEAPVDAGASVIVDEKTRKITIVRPEDNKAPAMLLDDGAATATVFQPQPVAEYVLPSLELLQQAENFDYSGFESEVYSRAEVLEKIVARFGFKIKVEEIQLGPVITQYQISLDDGLRVSKIVNLADDIAVQLGVANVRIVHPLPGKTNLVGIEIPNIRKQWVYLRQVMEELAGTYAKASVPMFLGKDVAGKAMMTDLAKLPHLLIAGRTGTGKSVCLNSIIVSMLMTRGPADVKMIMIDPKMVEMSQYATIPHLMHPVITDMKKAEAVLAWAVDKMEERYTWLSRAKVRHMDVYNKLTDEERLKRIAPQPEEMAQVPARMPYIVIIVDEMSDLMMTAPKEVESHIIRLAQKSRAVGIHLILATQKPTVDVITGLIKSNLPARIAFQVSSKTDSRVVLDENGADRLLGNGDMLFLKPGTSILIRGQGTYLSDEEIINVIDAISVEKPQFDPGIISSSMPGGEGDMEAMRQRDELYVSAVDVIVREQRGSISLLQRMLGIGYGRAARLIDYMAEDGIVGPFKGYTQPREVFMSIETWEAKQRISASADGGGASVGVAPVAAYAPRASTEIPEDENDYEDEEDGPDDDVRAEAPTPENAAYDDAETEEEDDEDAEDEVDEDEAASREDVYGNVDAVVDDLRRRMTRRKKNQGETEDDGETDDDADEDESPENERFWYGEEDEDEDGDDENDEEDDDDFYEGMNTPQPPWDDSSGGRASGGNRGGSDYSGGKNRHERDDKRRKKPKKNRFRKVPKPPQSHTSPQEEAVLARIEPNQPAPFIRPGKVTDIHGA